MATTPLDALRASADRLAALVGPLTPVDLRRSAYPTAAADTADAVDLELPAEGLVRLVYGRLDPDHTPLVDGSPADLEELRRTFPGV